MNCPNCGTQDVIPSSLFFRDTESGRQCTHAVYPSSIDEQCNALFRKWMKVSPAETALQDLKDFARAIYRSAHAPRESRPPLPSDHNKESHDHKK